PAISPEGPNVAEPDPVPPYTLDPPLAASFSELLVQFDPSLPGEWSELSLATRSWLEQDRGGFLEGIPFPPPGDNASGAVNEVIKGVVEFARSLGDDELLQFTVGTT